MNQLSPEEALCSLLYRLLTKQRRDEQTGCLMFTGALNSHGYGILEMNGISYGAHRVAAFFCGIITSLDDDCLVCHHCDNRACVEETHIYKGDEQSNMRDKVTRGRSRNGSMDKTHCKMGHPLEGENLNIRSNGTRRCITCTNIQNTKARNKKRGMVKAA